MGEPSANRMVPCTIKGREGGYLSLSVGGSPRLPRAASPSWPGAEVLRSGQGTRRRGACQGKARALSSLPGCQLPPQVSQEETTPFCPMLTTWVFVRTLQRFQWLGIFQSAPYFSLNPTPRCVWRVISQQAPKIWGCLFPNWNSASGEL